MKLFLTLSCLFASVSILFSQTDLLTTDPIIVADGYGNHHPQIEVTNDDRVNITWTSPGTESAYFAKHNGFDGFGTPVKLNPEGLGVASYTWSGPDFAIEGSNVYAVFRSTNFQSYLVKSTDHGATFGDTVRIASETALYPFYPDVAVLNDTVYATFMNHLDGDGGTPNYVFSRSTDGGASFESFILASDIMSDEVCDCCPPEILVNEKYVIIFFRNNEDNVRDIKAVISYDRGETFSEWISVDDHEWVILSCPSTGPDARFISEDVVVSTYKSVVGTDAKVFVNVYDLEADASLSTTDIQATDSPNMFLNYPQISYDNDQLGLVWEGLGDGTSVDIFFNHSPTDAIDFNPDNALNLTNMEGTQAKPDVALKNGIYNVVYSNGNDGNLYYLQVGEPNQLTENQNYLIQTYPNPFKESLFINYNASFAGSQLEVVDLQGKVYYSGLYNGSTEINTATWPAGVYILRITNSESTTVTKVLKVN